MKRDKFDIIFSNSIRLRDNFTCTRCKKYYPENERQGLHCSHIFSRRHKATRWEPLNATSHCFYCHQYLGGNPVLFEQWSRENLGSLVVDMLIEKHQRIIKLTKKDKVEMYKFMKEEYQRMLKIREYDNETILTFAGYL